MPINKDILIGIVGPCGAGKSTLSKGLINHGYKARPIAQEHSYVPSMWRQLTNPDLLIFLQASCSVGARRRNMSWTEAEWQEQQRRLQHAREHADYYLDTDLLDIPGVFREIMNFLEN
jgi:cytidylate kinase